MKYGIRYYDKRWRVYEVGTLNEQPRNYWLRVTAQYACDRLNERA